VVTLSRFGCWAFEKQAFFCKSRKKT
jgi:hypothetical protein